MLIVYITKDFSLVHLVWKPPEKSNSIALRAKRAFKNEIICSCFVYKMRRVLIKVSYCGIFECFSNTVYQYFFYGHYSINRALASGAYFRFPFLFEHLATAVLLPNNHGGKEHSKNLLSHFSPIGSKAFWCFLIPDFAPFNSWILPKLAPFLVKTRL